MRRLAWLLSLSLVGCGSTGEGRVDAEFSTPECPPGEALGDLEDYGWDADALVTERYEDALVVLVQRYDVDVVETDSVSFLLDLGDLEDAGHLARRGDLFELSSPPLSLPVGLGEGQIQVLLGLYGTCPFFPNFEAVAGTVELDVLDIRRDGADTGRDERIVGRVLTASVAPPGEDPYGVLEASFDFEPPRRPLREFE